MRIRSEFLIFYQNGSFKKLKTITASPDLIPVDYSVCGELRYLIQLPKLAEDWQDALLQIHYQGDIGQAFVDGRMVSDNYDNGTTWEIGLKALAERLGLTSETLSEKQMVIRVIPLKADRKVDVSSTMAGQMEQYSGVRGELFDISLKPVTSEMITVKID